MAAKKFVMKKRPKVEEDYLTIYEIKTFQVNTTKDLLIKWLEQIPDNAYINIDDNELIAHYSFKESEQERLARLDKEYAKLEKHLEWEEENKLEIENYLQNKKLKEAQNKEKRLQKEKTKKSKEIARLEKQLEKMKKAETNESK